MSTYGTIILAASHGLLNIVKNEQITCDSVNSLKIKFDFRTADWNTMTKMAVFWNKRDYSNNNDDTQISVVLDESCECFIPHEIINQSGNFMVGVFGVFDNKRLTTNFLEFKINQGCYAACSASVEPTPTTFAQLSTLINAKIGAISIDNVAQTVNNGGVNINMNSVLSHIAGYNSGKQQTLKNINGVFQWVDEN